MMESLQQRLTRQDLQYGRGRFLTVTWYMKLIWKQLLERKLSISRIILFTLYPTPHQLIGCWTGRSSSPIFIIRPGGHVPFRGNSSTTNETGDFVFRR